MKKSGLILLFLFLGINLFCQTRQKVEIAFPSDMECIAQPYYGYRQDGKAGRAIILKLKGAKLFGKSQVEVDVKGKKEVTEIPCCGYCIFILYKYCFRLI